MSTEENAPWLSVIIPVFNGATTLENTLASIDTSDRGIEVVAVDQGSTDGSVQILRSFKDRLRLSVINAPQNTNWMQNTNLGVAHATAPYLTMLHQDDVWRPERPACLRHLLKEYPEAAVWAHDADYIDDRGKVIGRFGPPFGKKATLISSPKALETLVVQNTLALPAVMFPRDAYLSAGGLDQSLWYTADWDLWLKLLATGPVAWSPIRAAAFRIHGASQTLRGSRDISDFHKQLRTPLERHGAGLPDAVRARAELSQEVNVWLADRFHGGRPSLGKLIHRTWKLGPIGFSTFLRDSQLFARVLPRLRRLGQ